MCTVRGEGERARREAEIWEMGESIIPPLPHLRPLGLNEKLYARKTRVKKIKKHACVVQDIFKCIWLS